VKKSVGMWKYPRWIVFVDALPMTATARFSASAARRADLRPIAARIGDNQKSLEPSGMLEIGDARLEYRHWGPAPSVAPTILLLHEGLGCLGLWGDFPAKLAGATGVGVFAYSRGLRRLVAGRSAAALDLYAGRGARSLAAHPDGDRIPSGFWRAIPTALHRGDFTPAASRIIAYAASR